MIGDSADKEDVYIRYLEGKLGWKKNGAKTSAYGSGLVDDGLDGMYMSSPAFPARSIENLLSELLVDLDTFQSSMVREGPGETIGFYSSHP